MSYQRQVPGGHYVCETTPGRQAQIPGGVFYYSGLSGSLSGTISVNATPTGAGTVVALYLRDNGSSSDYTLFMLTTTDGSGNYSFVNINPSLSWFVLAFDPAGGSQYNIGRHDRLTPG
jgi:hypothetical protein